MIYNSGQNATACGNMLFDKDRLNGTWLKAYCQILKILTLYIFVYMQIIWIKYCLNQTVYGYTVNLEFSRGVHFRETSHIRSFVKIKLSRYEDITLSFTDICKSCPDREFWMSLICLSTLFAKIKFSRKFPNLQYTLIRVSLHCLHIRIGSQTVGTDQPIHLQQVIIEMFPRSPRWTACLDLGGCWLPEVNKEFLGWTWSVLRRFYFIYIRFEG